MTRQRRTVGPSDPSTLSSASASTTATAPNSLPSHIKKRPHRTALVGHDESSMRASQDDSRPLVDGAAADDSSTMAAKTWTSRNQWIVLALASGGCAAFNGVFAKLTTTELTTTLSQGLARFLGLSTIESGIEVILRSIFFGLNLAFNGVMWALFTKALTRGNSTTQVSIINTSANFVITAILGFAIFSEALPPLWWLGAAMLVAGNVIIGRKDEGSKQGDAAVNDDADAGSTAFLTEDGQGTYQPVAPLDGAVPHKKDEDEDILDLELDDMS